MRKAWLGAAALISIIAAGAWLHSELSAEQIVLGPDLCPVDPSKRSPTLVVVLFDQTDQLIGLQQTALKSYFKKLLFDEFEEAAPDRSTKFARIELYSFRSPGNAKGLQGAVGDFEINNRIAICNPGRPSKFSKLYEQPEQVRKRYREKFIEPLDREFGALLEFKNAASSPIFEAIKHTSLTVLSDPRFRSTRKRLIVSSDLLQNTQQFSFYRSYPEFRKFAQSPYAKRIFPDLRGVSVTVLLYTSAQGERQDARFRKFWDEYFRRANAQHLKFIRIP